MRSMLFATYAALSSAFVPQQMYRAPTFLAASKHGMTGDVDTDAKYCADHFGECSLHEMERIRDALHEERITHVFSNTDGINNPHGIQEDVAHKLLESDLTLQMGLLKDKLATEHMQEDSRAAFGMNPMSATMNLPVIDGMVDEESSEAIMICLTIAALALLPQFM
mmetsp:Transcript_16377/g.23215  ORF Transcript_16377/g.23215 Transcript_16377/m.23215 type:complete len:166 (+) Transcript_16377:141-638(+)|eukprot:CAMPEP_0201686110 /NCGR_PEP_ID=MMETSP0578-20130828/666_1 /ASSEMBLY_ACC=CAM_ASM_000663 /TAXON_ID=267565 /ORGANISM="Skeletonema grethea, Strain CCMP 1804" /LENGTH=165 /DNA_ID=CAMNT_0048170115 /DNA_START=132 /DNA_END=629 /DNA_ORIENTATION=+